MISTPGGKIVTNLLAKNTPLNILGRIYKTHLIVLSGQGIDVILGMSQMRELVILGFVTKSKYSSHVSPGSFIPHSDINCSQIAKCHEYSIIIP
jgi:hypothetical protein